MSNTKNIEQSARPHVHPNHQPSSQRVHAIEQHNVQTGDPSVQKTHTLALYMEYPDLWPKEEKICPLGFYCIVLVWCGRFFTKSPCPERCKGPRCLDDC